MSTAAVEQARIDRDWFALAWYGQTVRYLCGSVALTEVGPDRVDALDRLPNAATGHAVAVSADLVETTPAAPIVIGGPCINDCTRWPTLEALYDSLMPMLLARRLGGSVLLYLGDREEVMGSTGPGKAWLRLAERFARWLPPLGTALGLGEVHVVRTSSERHEAALAAVLGSLGELLGERLDRAFHLGGGAVREQGEAAREVARRVIAAHLPAVVAAHVPAAETARPVVMSENLQQAEVFRLAREVAEAGGASLSYVGHWPAPSLSARMRMYRSCSWDKIPAGELATILERPVPGLHPRTREFFARWLEPAERAAVVAAAQAW